MSTTHSSLVVLLLCAASEAPGLVFSSALTLPMLAFCHCVVFISVNWRVHGSQPT